jgi:hypothetical protein
MQKNHCFRGSLIVLVMMFFMSANAQTTAFTYQGNLRDGGGLANGTYDFRFRIYDALAGGTQQGGTLTRAGTQVANGLFTVQLDFGVAPFLGGRRWMEILVKKPADVNYTTLIPRVELTSSPYALFAHTANAIALQGRNLSANAPALGEVLKWNGNVWLPMPDIDTDTQYAAGAGLQLAGNAFSIPNQAITRLMIRWGNIEPDHINPQGAADGQTLIWDANLNQVVWGDPGGFKLPYDKTKNDAATLFSLTNNGTGGAGAFRIRNANSSSVALIGDTNGGGGGIPSVGMRAVHRGVLGSAAEVRILNAGSPSDSLLVSTIGTGSAIFAAADVGSAVLAANQGANPTVSAFNFGAGHALLAVASGGGSAGEFISLAPGMPTVKASNNVGTDVIVASSRGAGGAAGYFEVDDPNGLNATSALYAIHTARGDALTAIQRGPGAPASGRAGLFTIDNVANNHDSLEARTIGTGRAGMFRITNINNSVAGIEVRTNGLGQSGLFVITNPNNAQAAAFAITNGQGPAVYGLNTGAAGQGGYFDLQNPNNNASALYARTLGLGNAGFFELQNAGSNRNAIFATSNSSGASLFAVSTGIGRASEFLVTNPGNANGALVATTNGLGRAGEFQVNNANNQTTALFAWNNGVDGLLGFARAGDFVAANANNQSPALTAFHQGLGRAANSEPALFVETIGTGRAGNFQIMNAGSGQPALFTFTNGLGNAAVVSVNNAGSGANALQVFTNGPGDALYSQAGTGRAGFFFGNVHVQGQLSANVKLFTIDHPLDPQNKYLNHACVESAEMMNIYSGNVVLDAKGEGWVQVPDWFNAVNTDLRYQLTCIGGHAPVYIAEELSNGRFKVAGGRAGLKVSWQITATRNDPYARNHPLQVEQMKPAGERGRYLNPELYGQDRTSGIGYREPVGPAMPAQPATPGRTSNTTPQ